MLPAHAQFSTDRAHIQVSLSHTNLQGFIPLSNPNAMRVVIEEALSNLNRVIHAVYTERGLCRINFGIIKYMMKQYVWGFLLNLVVFGQIVTQEDVIRNRSIVPDPQNARPVLETGLEINQNAMKMGADGSMVWLLYSANKMTPGYKRVKPYTVLKNGEVTLETYPLFVPGPPLSSNRDYDLYIQNPRGYFFVESESGMRFLMRDGRFKKDPSTQYLVTVSGQHRVLSEDLTPIQIPNADIYVTHSGDIIAGGEPIATLRIVLVSDLNQLDIVDGMRLYADSEFIRVVPPHQRLIQQGFYEGSAVPKALPPDTRGIYRHIYLSSSYAAKRNIRMMKNSIRLNP